MKVSICDPCAVGGDVTLSKFRLKHQGPGAVTLHVCVDHNKADWGKGKTKEDFYKTAIEAESKIVDMQGQGRG